MGISTMSNQMGIKHPSSWNNSTTWFSRTNGAIALDMLISVFGSREYLQVWALGSFQKNTQAPHIRFWICKQNESCKIIIRNVKWSKVNARADQDKDSNRYWICTPNLSWRQTRWTQSRLVAGRKRPGQIWAESCRKIEYKNSSSRTSEDGRKSKTSKWTMNQSLSTFLGSIFGRLSK